MPVPIEIESLLISLMFFGSIMVFYKDNPIYMVIEALVVGAILANEVEVALRAIYTTILTPIFTRGMWINILPLAMGAMYFFIFSRRYNYIYRLISVITIASTFGLVQSGQLATMFVTLMVWATSLTDISSLVLIIGVITTMLYFTFSKQLEAPLRHVRSVGKLYLFAFFGISVGTMWWRYTNYAIGFVMRAIIPPGIYIPIIFAIYILLDSVGGLERVKQVVAAR